MKTKLITICLLLGLSFINCANADIASLCGVKERIVWSCQTSSKLYSVCASNDLAAATGYLQYRAGTSKKTDFNFPATLLHPKGQFEFAILAHGAMLTFNNKKITYTIIENLKSETTISVDKGTRSLATIKCSDSTQSLTENATIDLFKTAGITQ